MLKQDTPIQCSTCHHYQRRGGIVFLPEMTCVRLEGSETAEVLCRVLQALAAEQRCPDCKPYKAEPGAYISEDLNPIANAPLSNVKIPRVQRKKKS